MLPMSSATKTASLIMAAVGAAAIAALLVWLFAQQSTLGLVQWAPEWRRIFILVGICGLIPLVLGAIESIRRGTVLAIVTIAFSVLAIVLAGALFGYIASSAYALKEPLPAVKLLNPKAGIAADSQGMVRLSLSSDPHWGASTAKTEARSAILRSVAASKRDAFFILGDNVETGMNDDYWQAEARDLALLGPVPVRPILGNHDGIIGGQYHFTRYLFPAGISTDSGSPYYYSLDAGAAKIIVLNLLWGTESFDRSQEAWLERTLAALPAGKQVIVLSHCFFYASGYVDKGMPWYDHKGTIGKVSPILERHKVALVVSGHNHYMEYLEHNGVSYAVIGAMGGLLDPEPAYVSPASLWLKQGCYGRLDLDIASKGISLTFRDQDGTALHEAFIPAAR
jgi:UDP-2,3-diacylglucosamine pyrophosphatase LpxH